MPPNFAIEATLMLDRNATGIARYCTHLLRELDSLAAEEAGGFRLTQLYPARRLPLRDRLLRGAALSSQIWHRSWWPPRKPYALVHCTGFWLPTGRCPRS